MNSFAFLIHFILCLIQLASTYNIIYDGDTETDSDLEGVIECPDPSLTKEDCNIYCMNNDDGDGDGCSDHIIRCENYGSDYTCRLFCDRNSCEYMGFIATDSFNIDITCLDGACAESLLIFNKTGDLDVSNNNNNAAGSIKINCGTSLSEDDDETPYGNCQYMTIVSDYDNDEVNSIVIDCSVGSGVCDSMSVISQGTTNINMNCELGEDQCYQSTVFGLFSNDVTVKCSDRTQLEGSDNDYENSNCQDMLVVCPYDGTCKVNLTDAYDYDPFYIASYAGTSNLEYYNPSRNATTGAFTVTNAQNVMLAYGEYLQYTCILENSASLSASSCTTRNDGASERDFDYDSVLARLEYRFNSENSQNIFSYTSGGDEGGSVLKSVTTDFAICDNYDNDENGICNVFIIGSNPELRCLYGVECNVACLGHGGCDEGLDQTIVATNLNKYSLICSSGTCEDTGVTLQPPTQDMFKYKDLDVIVSAFGDEAFDDSTITVGSINSLVVRCNGPQACGYTNIEAFCSNDCNVYLSFKDGAGEYCDTYYPITTDMWVDYDNFNIYCQPNDEDAFPNDSDFTCTDLEIYNASYDGGEWDATKICTIQVNNVTNEWECNGIEIYDENSVPTIQPTVAPTDPSTDTSSGGGSDDSGDDSGDSGDSDGSDDSGDGGDDSGGSGNTGGNTSGSTDNSNSGGSDASTSSGSSSSSGDNEDVVIVVAIIGSLLFVALVGILVAIVYFAVKKSSVVGVSQPMMNQREMQQVYSVGSAGSAQGPVPTS